MKTKKQNNKVAIIMGSQSDYSVMKDCEKILKLLKVKYQTLIVSAHRTPKRMYEYSTKAEAHQNAVEAFDQIITKLKFERLNPSLEPSHAFAEAIRIAPK